MYNALGLVVSTAAMGKTTEHLGDPLGGFQADVQQSDLDLFFKDPSGPIATQLLAKASSRVMYDVNRFWINSDNGSPSSVAPPSYSVIISRETHRVSLYRSPASPSVYFHLLGWLRQKHTDQKAH